MVLTSKNNFSFWQFDLLANQSELIHFITYKNSLKKEDGKSLNFRNGNTHFHDSLKVITDLVEIEPDSIYMAHQSHSKNIMRIKKGDVNRDIEDVDAFISGDFSVCLTVKTADCVPILLYDPKIKVIASVHAGWRGTVKKILQAAIMEMISHYGSIPENILAGIGPSICPHCYEVGQEVVSAVIEEFSYWKDILIKDDEKTYLDLQEANRQQLIHAGINPKHIETCPICTYENTDVFYSARKEGTDTGRIISGILFKPVNEVII